MAEGYNVKLSVNSQIIFPRECIVCGHESDKQKMSISIRSGYSKPGFSKLRRSIDAPMHKECAAQYRLTLWKRYGILFFVLAIFFLIFILYFNISKEPFLQYSVKRIIHFAFLVIFLILLDRWHSNHPLSIECEYERGHYIFTFKDRSYADKFAQINKSTVENRANKRLKNDAR